MNELIPRQLSATGSIANESSSSNGATTRTILRIKRRRTETPIPCIRLEGLVNNTDHVTQDAAMSELHQEKEENFRHNKTKRQRSSAVLWKRFDPSDDNPSRDIGNGNQHEDGEKIRIVDAMFLSTEGESEEGDIDNNLRLKKRRKLTLLDSSMIDDAPPSNPKSLTSSSIPVKKKKKKKPLRVLDPLTRVVDDSLQEVLVGEKTVEAHYRQLTTDPRFTLRDVESQTKWMTWSLEGGTNLLHCCALWNEASIANELLQRFGARDRSVRSSLMENLDGDGRTPYEIAQLIGHHRVCEVLEVYGGDTSNYVYDIFYLDQDGLVKTRPNDDSATAWDNENFDEGPGITTAELTSGIGYWTPDGELILETTDYERRARSMSEETEGDIDSNCEEHGGNDYPDEEEYEDPMDGYGVNRYHNEYDIDHDDDDGYEYDWEQDLH